jgi:peptide/nickel transport system ATP-binding protein
MLRISNLTVKFPTRFGESTVVDSVDLEVGPGEIHGLVGESGAGKSTIGAAITGLLPEPGYMAGGSIVLGGTRLDTLSPRERHATRGKRISMIFQDPQTSLNPLMTIEAQLVETILTHEKMSLAAARTRALELLRETGIVNPESRIGAYPHQFSGGMRQRVVIALALCSNPELVVADEPTTALDVAVQSQVLNLIRRLALERRLGIILITHDIGVIAQVSDRVTVLRYGRVVEAGATGDVLGRPQAGYTQSLMASVPRIGRRLHRFATIEDRPATDSQSQSRVPEGSSAQYATAWLMQERPHADGSIADALLQIDALTVSFGASGRRWFRRPTPVQALRDVSLSVMPGKVLGLIGESGSGKSTLARAVVGLVSPAAGTICYAGRDLRFGRHRPRNDPSRRKIQMIFQDPYSSLNNRRKIADILAEPLVIYGIEHDHAMRQRLVASVLELVGMPADAMHRYPHQFSGGQRQRIAVARALLARPEFLICDEPTSALDVSIQAQILNLLKDLQERFALTILFISHNLAVVRQMADQVAVLKSGTLVEAAASEAFFAGPRHPYSQELLRLTPSLDLLEPPAGN